MIAVKKETLEDSLTRILWYYLNNDFNLNMVARELFSRESAALALQTGHSVDEFLKSGAYPVSYTHLDVYKRQCWCSAAAPV